MELYLCQVIVSGIIFSTARDCRMPSAARFLPSSFVRLPPLPESAAAILPATRVSVLPLQKPFPTT